jgi:hypothetical protein
MPGPAPTATPFPLALQDFLTRAPEFKTGDTGMIAAALNDAALRIDASVWGPSAGEGHYYLTAHKLAISPFGQNARLVAKDGTTTYGKEFDRLSKLMGSGFRVL